MFSVTPRELFISRVLDFSRLLSLRAASWRETFHGMSQVKFTSTSENSRTASVFRRGFLSLSLSPKMPKIKRSLEKVQSKLRGSEEIQTTSKIEPSARSQYGMVKYERKKLFQWRGIILVLRTASQCSIPKFHRTR